MGILIILSVILSFSSTVVFAKKYGAEFQLKSQEELSQVVKRAKGKPDYGPVQMQVEVEQVCQSKGCWMTLKGAKEPIRVTFKDYGFFVPKNLKGQTVKIEGTMTTHKMSLAETKHYVKDAGGDPKQVKEARTELRFVATSVQTVEKP